MQGADLGLWDLDVKSGKAVVNERAAQMAGYESHELDPTMSLLERLCHPEDKERVLRALSAHMNRESPGLDEEVQDSHKVRRMEVDSGSGESCGAR